MTITQTNSKTEEVVAKQKEKLEQKKNKLLAEEIKLKLKEQKIRTKQLIEIGQLVAKAKLDFLPNNTLYGALLSLSKALDEEPEIRRQWTQIGQEHIESEEKQFTPIILKFSKEPSLELRNTIRQYGLRWNKFRREWFGNIQNLPELEKTIKNAKDSDLKYDLEILRDI